jgi:AcrR family transcriptional regulator
MKPRSTYHHGDLPEALLAAADALIKEKGVGGFSLREAARKVGVDPAASYRHFRDKDAVVQALARRGFTRLAARMHEGLQEAGRSPERKLFTLGHTYVAFALDEPSAFRAMFGPTGVDARDDLLRGTYPVEQGPYHLVQRTLRDWAREGEHKLDIDEASVTLWAGVHGLACLLIEGALRPGGATQRERAVEAAIETMLLGLAQGQPARRKPTRARARPRKPS